MANLSQQKRERMLAFLKTLKAQHTDDDSLIALGEIEKELKSKKYGLVWEEHEEAVDVMMRTHIPVFTVDDSMEINGDPNSEQYNFLLEGDNLHSLHLLEKTHRGKIDLIYIDPPYNTLSEGFVYSDKLIDKTDGFEHSKWASLIYSRIVLSRRLLSQKGVIFISIDDNELYSLKLICDEVFGSDNYVSTITVIVKPEGRRYGAFAKTHEYILVYAKSIDDIELNEIEVEGAKYQYSDDFGGFNLKGLRNRNVRAFNSTNRPNLRYPFYIDTNNPDANGLFKVSTEYMDGYEEVWASTIDGLESVWRWGKETASKKIDELTAYRGKDNEIRIFQKERKLSQTAKTLWNEKDFISQKGTKEIQEILGKGKFDFPKPLELIKRILTIGTNKHTTVLDFFAGSGTTGHAVMELNKKDGGQRRFILCTNNENGICENVTYQRLKTVITGKRKDGSEYSEGIPANLMYFRTDFVDKESEELSEELLEHIREMIQLEHGVKIDDQKYVIIMDDEEMDAFEQNIENYPDLRVVFINQEVFLSSSQEAMLENIDTYIIPDYYFDFELREAGEIW